MSETETVNPEVEETDNLTLDALHQLAADEEKVEQAQKELLTDSGTWTTVPDGKEPKVSRPKDGKNKGRLLVRYFQKIEMVKKDKETGEEVAQTAYHAYTISPEIRRHTEGRSKGKVDLPSRLYLNAVAAMKRSGGIFTGPGSVAEFLRDYPVRLRIKQMDATDEFDASTLVLSISPVRIEEMA